MEKLGKYPFVAEQYQCNFRKQIFLSFLVNQMLCSADNHSTERELGTEQLNKIGRTWVLSRFAVELKDLPLRHSKYSIETWVENAVMFFTNRNFRVTLSDGDIIAWGRSTWAMLDMNSREPVNIFDIKDGLIKKYIIQDGEKESITAPIEKPSRIAITEDLELKRVIDTYYNDVDFNGHINSARYIEHVLDLFPMEWHKEYIIKRFEIVYVAESHCPDKLKFYISSPKEGDSVEYKVRITKLSPNSLQEIECCRCKLIWRKII